MEEEKKEGSIVKVTDDHGTNLSLNGKISGWVVRKISLNGKLKGFDSSWHGKKAIVIMVE